MGTVLRSDSQTGTTHSDTKRKPARQSFLHVGDQWQRWRRDGTTVIWWARPESWRPLSEKRRKSEATRRPLCCVSNKCGGPSDNWLWKDKLSGAPECDWTDQGEGSRSDSCWQVKPPRWPDSWLQTASSMKPRDPFPGELPQFFPPLLHFLSRFSKACQAFVCTQGTCKLKEVPGTGAGKRSMGQDQGLLKGTEVIGMGQVDSG